MTLLLRRRRSLLFNLIIDARWIIEKVRIVFVKATTYPSARRRSRNSIAAVVIGSECLCQFMRFSFSNLIAIHGPIGITRFALFGRKFETRNVGVRFYNQATSESTITSCLVCSHRRRITVVLCWIRYRQQIPSSYLPLWRVFNIATGRQGVVGAKKEQPNGGQVCAVSPNKYAEGMGRNKRVLEEMSVAPNAFGTEMVYAAEENDQRTIALLKIGLVLYRLS
ncbi:hypothetical protein M378DRAFT_399022 [Amanita muscaria Koide BX008]|uniref:Uncharacterized protein n=1 Tax=Amanita muscaria (strain Koide BX008) TaxID=946122 RepID=A0A0C2W7W3_AMAMK|nr:hypothetical protein M378DRAFT_399022 [Amanita muscaria Koide BX008]